MQSLLMASSDLGSTRFSQPTSAPSEGQVWLVGARPGLERPLMAAMAATKSPDGAGFFALEWDGSHFVRSQDVVAVRTDDGFVVFTADGATGNVDPAATTALDEALLSASAKPIRVDAREALFVQLMHRRSHAPPVKGETYLGRSLEILQGGCRERNPHLLRQTAEDLLEEIDGDETGTLRALLHRLRARALAQIGRTTHRLQSDLAQQLSQSYLRAEKEFWQADLPRQALGCRRERRVAHSALLHGAQGRLPGITLPPPVREVGMPPDDAGFVAMPCILVPLKPIKAAQSAMERATNFTLVGDSTANPSLVSSAVRRIRSDSLIPVLSARRGEDPASVVVDVKIREEHAALLRVEPPRNRHSGTLFVALHWDGGQADPPWAKVSVDEQVSFKFNAAVGRRIDVELTVNDACSSFTVPIEAAA